MEKVKVCHLTSVHPYYDTRIFIKECQTLVSEGYELHLIAPNAPNEIKKGVHLHGIISTETNRWKRMTSTVTKVYNKANEIDAEIYHFHDPELIPIGLLLKIKGKKVIYDVHEDVPRQIMSKHWIPKHFRRVISWLFEKFENLSSRHFDAIIAATKTIGNRFINKSKRVININNFPKLEEFLTDESQWIKKDKVVCYIGGISKIRGLYEMIEAMGYTDATLLLAGKFERIEDQENISETSGYKRVKYLGFLNRTEAMETLSRSMAGMVVFHPVPNHIEALPNKMFEYMSAGLPVIASNFPLWKEIIEQNKCGICVDPLNPKEIAEAIQRIIENQEEAKKMGERGRQLIKSTYNWESESQKLLSLYMEIYSYKSNKLSRSTSRRV